VNSRDRFDKFTERARQVLHLAQEEAQRFQHNYIGTEHILLGLTRLDSGVAIEVLKNLDVEVSKVRSSVEYIIGRGDRIILGEIGLTPRAKKVIELAVEEARRLNHHYIGTEHLLLGLIRQGDSIAAGVLTNLGVDLEKARTQTLIVLNRGKNSPSGDAEAPFGEDVPSTSSPFILKDAAPTDPSSIIPPAEHTALQGQSTQQSGEPFDKFTEQARKALSLAQEEAQGFQHNYIGTEHLLLGLLHEDKSLGAQVLKNLGVELARVRSAVVFIIGRGDRIVLGEIGLTPRAKKVLELSIDEAQRMGHDRIGTEHILLGLVREGEGIAAGVLTSMGVKLEQVRAETLKALKPPEET
jgi:ATP-dependent Clp protease ATP-binding subunit ClpA